MDRQSEKIQYKKPVGTQFWLELSDFIPTHISQQINTEPRNKKIIFGTNQK